MLWRDLKTWQIYGANTDVGKTIISTILCRALQRRTPNASTLYLKPVSTGALDEADDRHISKYAPGVISTCLSQFSVPVSPHLAAQIDSRNGKLLKDDKAIIKQTKLELNRQLGKGVRYALLETAGGVLSPGPSGTAQADLYRPLRLPSLLVGDSKLGGIGTTISAFESLHIRGYDVDSVLLFDDPAWGNAGYLREHFAKHKIETTSLPLPPPRQADSHSDEQALDDYYQSCAASPAIASLIDLLNAKHFSRVSKLTSLPSLAESIIWHPFRQHGIPHNIIAIDSAYKDHFDAYNQTSDPNFISQSNSSTAASGFTPPPPPPCKPLTTPLFDASASWWTQGLGHGNPDLSLTAAYASGRYGHVMFAHSVHEPALDLSYSLLSTLRNPRLARVFFSDNGSTGMEVAVKMALRATCHRYGWNKDDSKNPVGVLGLKGSYHGDTIGVMNCSEPSVFNEKVDWYQPWGFWFDPPQVLLKDGQWTITLPDSFSSSHDTSPSGSGSGSGRTLTFPSLASIFDYTSRPEHAALYKSYITSTLHRLVHEQHRRFGALMIEPIVMGAGGMIFVDPLFQRTLIKTIREDATIFDAFVSDSKTDALLHGHSYTAHPIGCAVANRSLDVMARLSAESAAWTDYKTQWAQVQDGGRQQLSAATTGPGPELFSFFSPQFLHSLSKHPGILGCWALGSVLAMTLKAKAGAGAGGGYSSNVTAGLQERLLTTLDFEGRGIHSRVLGDVLYIICSMTTEQDEVRSLERQVIEALNQEMAV
ncbi:hypothetical protein DV735_g816, partial [Chaetothyriales sp. CBS 134920]